MRCAGRPAVSDAVRIGVVGLGYWGPNLARNFDGLADAELSWICDGSQDVLDRVASRFPGARATGSLDYLPGHPDLDAVAIATPVPSHADVALRVLAGGKHCFVEKPLAQSTEEAEAVVEAADHAGRTLMVGHLLEYHPGVERLKELVDSGELGDVHYIYGNRLNLGQVRREENALWSLGAHDVSVVLRLAGEEPVECHAHGESYMQERVEDVVFCYLRFPSGVAAHLHLSWLDPHKEGRFTVVGSKKMATFDDMALEDKLTLYDRVRPELPGLRRVHRPLGGRLLTADLQRGTAHDRVPPLRERLRDGQAPRSDGEAGVRVVRVLEELQRSLDAGRRTAQRSTASISRQ